MCFGYLWRLLVSIAGLWITGKVGDKLEWLRKCVQVLDKGSGKIPEFGEAKETAE